MNKKELVANWDKLFNKKDLDGAKALRAVKRNGYALQYVANQTEAICLEAVKQDGYALRYVTDQTEAICLEAVRRHGYALQYVANQTESICLEAVKQDGCALQHVSEYIINKWRAESESSCDGELVVIDGKQYKLTEVN
jgi:hypothetical protein